MCNLCKPAFSDDVLKKELFLTSANSINIARWLPQQFYYFFAYQQWHDKNTPPLISVPSGNFGNICAGLLAYKSGLPVKHFIAACNANDVFPSYIKSGNYTSQQSITTLSNAMDVGDPSNFVRILELFDQQFNSLKDIISSYSISDEEIKEVIKKVYQRSNYLLDPHGAVGYLGLVKYMQQQHGLKGIFLETAHPVKFYDVVEPIIQQPVPIPAIIQGLLKKEKQSIKMEYDYKVFKDYLLASG